MGKAAGCSVSPGTCAYVPTGGMLPEGADAMAMVEYCERLPGIGIAVSEAVSPGSDVLLPGEDAAAEDVILNKGTRLRPLEIGLLAAAGILEPPVYAPLSMTVISTGDELAAPGTLPAPGQIRDINSHLITALALQAGYAVTETIVLPDEEDLLRQAVQDAMEKSDVVVLSGGSSQGSKDMTAKIIGASASRGVLTHGLALKPGKPAITGYDDSSRCLLVGLPATPLRHDGVRAAARLGDRYADRAAAVPHCGGRDRPEHSRRGGERHAADGPPDRNGGTLYRLPPLPQVRPRQKNLRGRRLRRDRQKPGGAARRGNGAGVPVLT